MDTIRIVSMVGSNTGVVCRSIAEYFTRSGLSACLTEVDRRGDAEQQLDANSADVAFLCGPDSLRRAKQWEAMAAPVTKGARYKQRPMSFTDVVVARESSWKWLADVWGKNWALFGVDAAQDTSWFRHDLERRGREWRSLGRIIKTASREQALRMVAEGTADATAVDSAALEIEYKRHPELAPQLRVVQTFGPHASAPVVARTDLPAAVRKELRRLLLCMHEGDEGRAILASGLLSRFAEVEASEQEPDRRSRRRPGRGAGDVPSDAV